MNKPLTIKQITARLDRMEPAAYETFTKNLLSMLVHLPNTVEFESFKLVLRGYCDRAVEGALEQTRMDSAA